MRLPKLQPLVLVGDLSSIETAFHNKRVRVRGLGATLQLQDLDDHELCSLQENPEGESAAVTL